MCLGPRGGGGLGGGGGVAPSPLPLESAIATRVVANMYSCLRGSYSCSKASCLIYGRFATLLGDFGDDSVVDAYLPFIICS